MTKRACWSGLQSVAEICGMAMISQWLSWSNVVVMMVSFFLLLTMAASELSIISSVLIRVKWLGKAAQYGSFRQILVKQTHKKSSIIEVIKPTAAASSSSCPNLSENAKTAEWWRTAQGKLGGWEGRWATKSASDLRNVSERALAWNLVNSRLCSQSLKVSPFRDWTQRLWS